MMTLAAALAARIATAPTPEDRLALTPAIWRAHLAGSLTDDEAQHLATLTQPAPRRHDAPQRTPARKLPTQRSPDRARSIARRRTLATSGAVPCHLAAHFTVGEIAALTIMARAVQRHGRCDMTIGEIAARAGVSRTTTQNAARRASAMGLLRIQIRRVTATRNLPNRVTIISAEWLAWLRISPAHQGGGFKKTNTTRDYIYNKGLNPVHSNREKAREETKHPYPTHQRRKHMA